MKLEEKSTNPDSVTAPLIPIPLKIEPQDYACRIKSRELGCDEVYFIWGFGSDRNAEVSH